MTGRHSQHRGCPVKSVALTLDCPRRPAMQPRGHSSDISIMSGLAGNWRTPGPLGAGGLVVAVLACPRASEICVSECAFLCCLSESWTSM